MFKSTTAQTLNMEFTKIGEGYQHTLYMSDDIHILTRDMLSLFKVLVTTIDAQWEGIGDVGLARCEPALLPPCPTIRVISYSN